MGAICSSNDNNNASLPPQDLGELLQQAEKAGGTTPWLTEFHSYLTKLDTDSLTPSTPHTQKRTLAWRIPLLQFIIETRAILKKGASEEVIRTGLEGLRDNHLMEEGGLALSDYSLRERLVLGLQDWTEAGASHTRRGLMASSAVVLEGRVVTKEQVLTLLREAYLDSQVWDRMEKLYRKFCEKRAAGGLPPLAVILSIL